MKRTLFLFLALLLAFSRPASAEEVSPEALQKEHVKADRKEQEVRKLDRVAGQLTRRIDRIESNIAALQRKIRSQERILNDIRESERAARQEHFALRKEKDRIHSELRGLLQSLWPVHMQNTRAKFQGIGDWASLDRRFAWLSDIYDATKGKFEEARVNYDRITRNLERQRILEEEAKIQLARINGNKDTLLKDKYALRGKLGSIRKERRDAEAELKSILSVIEDIKYQLQSQKTKRFAYYKRSLPWPAQGRVVEGFAPNAKPPVRGIALSVGANSDVRSVFWGKVVHNDTLRGFGRVVIVYHGYDYYSLYAYLEDSYVRMGQEVEKDEPIGKAGYCPKANGPGLYFELRFHQKPINPRVWLTAQK